MIILDAKTGFTVTQSARKDLALAAKEQPGVKGVWKSWAKLHEINKVRGVKQAQHACVAEAQQEYKVEVERRKNEIEKIQAEGGTVGGQ